ncbi:amidohydrolase/deacetylase family metallohydrolase [Ginsengibacter hankyongi]|uniref:Amidohydrolase/deacetylase family metallohydrolase n=1 Tax=Ginsengibacter hankyongi TaxID=2607284 RepID=A0A5J5II35_9BACT|nr:amidohydrolase/deacetylase family metallohydrolase [Ginsengibacter hankyongi]KAA9037714.1 amidohydrolase/deacetylase family metallohydrolase [Ginsengibacter hankyongi]
MLKKYFLLFSLFCIADNFVQAQLYSIVIKGGHVIDPKNKIDGMMDIAIKGDTIIRVAKNIDSKDATQVVDAHGLYITPGLIDIHTHDFYGNNPDQYLMDATAAIVPDGFTFRVGVTTVVDAGSSGWRTFPLFKEQTIDRSQTRVLAFLNIVGAGMRGGAYEQNTNDMDPQMAAYVAKEYKNYIVGFKVAHFEAAKWIPVDSAVEAGKLTNMPVMVDFGGDDTHPPLSIQELFFNHLRAGDIYTHTFTELKRRDPIVDTTTRTLKPFVLAAQQKGIVFDVGFGGASFDFRQAIPALKSGFYPNSISTDLHTGSMNAAMKNMLNIMSMFLAMGMDLPNVIQASTWNPAKEIQHTELGNLSVGSVADIAILNVRKGDFGYWDRLGYKIKGKQRLECDMTIRAGKIVYDLNGITNPEVTGNIQ